MSFCVVYVAEAAAAVVWEVTEYEKFLRVSVRAWLCLCVVYVAEAAAAVVWVVTEYEKLLRVSVPAWLCLFVWYMLLRLPQQWYGRSLSTKSFCG